MAEFLIIAGLVLTVFITIPSLLFIAYIKRRTKDKSDKANSTRG